MALLTHMGIPGAVVLWAALLSAQSPAPLPSATEAHALRLPIAVWMGAAAVDWATTYRFSTRYGDLMHEENPLISGLSGHPAMMVTAGSAIDAATAWTATRLLRGHPRLAQLTFYGAAAFRGYLAVHNVQMMRRADEIRRISAR
jgi:hypothetical protein